MTFVTVVWVESGDKGIARVDTTVAFVTVVWDTVENFPGVGNSVPLFGQFDMVC